MSSISIWKTKYPMHKVFAVVPGEMIDIQVTFGDQIPYQYCLQILDHRNNSRLNRYGRGSNQGIKLTWPIPRTIHDEHLGVWRIQVKADTYSFSQEFFVERTERIEPPMLVAASPLELVEEYEVAPVVTEEVLEITQEDSTPRPELDIQAEQPILTSKTPVTEIKGIGNTYADRLTKIKVYTISEFFYYPDRVFIAEIMRVNDAKLSRMLQYAENLLNEELTSPDIPTKSKKGISDDLISINGIGEKSVRKLAKLGITSRSDFIKFEDLELLRKTLRMSLSRLTKVLVSIGKIVTPPEVIPTEPQDPLVQPVIHIKGIGPITSQKLNQKGIMTVQDLLNSSFALFKDLTSERTYNKWKRNAATFAGQMFKEVSPSTKVTSKKANLTSITGIGAKTDQKLNSVGVMTLKDLIKVNLEQLAEKTRISKKRLIRWQAQAHKLLD